MISAQLETLPRSAPLADNFRRLKVEDPCVRDLATCCFSTKSNAKSQEPECFGLPPKAQSFRG